MNELATQRHWFCICSEYIHSFLYYKESSLVGTHSLLVHTPG